MKAILVNDDRSLIWSDIPNPVIKSDEVLIKVEYAAVNRADLMQREGNYPPPEGAPEWMGLEVSGTIEKVGEVSEKESKWKVGDRVCALLGGGGYAQYAAVRYDSLLPIPKNVSMSEAAAIPEAFATGYLNLFIEGKIKAGDTLLMQAGTSGLASVVIPMAKAFGIRVITTVRSKEKAKAIAHLGADIVVDTSKTNIEEVLQRQLEDGHPVDVAIDCLGGEIMGKSLNYMSHGGRWIMIAALAGTLTQIDLKNIYVRNVRIIGSTLRSRAPQFKAQILSLLEKDVWDKVSSGEIRPTVCKIFPITEAEKAQDMLYEGKSVGKVVLKVSEE